MKVVSLAILPVAVMLMGFTDKKLDASDGESFHASFQSMLNPLSQSQKEELAHAVFALRLYGVCEKRLAKDRVRYQDKKGAKSYILFVDETQCVRNVVVENPTSKNYLKTGRMDTNVPRKEIPWRMFAPDKVEHRGHSKEASWQKFVDGGANLMHGKSGHQIMKEYNDIAGRYDEAMQQYNIEYARSNEH